MVDFLPPPLPAKTRWTPANKVVVIRAIRSGILTPTEALHRYAISAEELATWEADYDRQGLTGLNQKAIRRKRRG